MREKLIEILRVPIFPHALADPTEAVADYLLDNDVVPVVRCKNCRHAERRFGVLFCKVWQIFLGKCDEGFCHRGERKDNDRD